MRAENESCSFVRGSKALLQTGTPKRPLNEPGAFRRWVRVTAVNLGRRWDEEHDRHVANRLLEIVRGDFDSTTWQTFRRLAMDGASGADVAAELGISVNAVLLAKSRVLRRLRQEVKGILD